MLVKWNLLQGSGLNSITAPGCGGSAEGMAVGRDGGTDSRGNKENIEELPFEYHGMSLMDIIKVMDEGGQSPNQPLARL